MTTLMQTRLSPFYMISTMSPNQAMQLTDDRRVPTLNFMITFSMLAELVLVSGS